MLRKSKNINASGMGTRSDGNKNGASRKCRTHLIKSMSKDRQKSAKNGWILYDSNCRKSLRFQGFCGIIKDMEKNVFEGLPAPVIEYISSLEKSLEKQQVQIDRLTELLRLAQKARFGSSSEKAKYILDGCE
jgi:hypothetical protein